jgi:hypothetical protein
MTRFYTAISGCIGAALLAASLTPAQATDLMSKAGMCFSASFPREDGPIKELTAIYHKDNDDAARVNIGIAYTEWDVPNQVFSTGAACERLGQALRCSIECDGGAVTLALSDNGHLMLETGYLTTDANGDASLLSMQESDGGRLAGLFSLAPRGKDDACQPQTTETFVSLQTGDIANRVKDTEQQLNALGHLLELPDEVFDDVTTKAVLQFQQQYRLPETGILDEQTSRLLAILVRRDAGGGC